MNQQTIAPTLLQKLLRILPPLLIIALGSGAAAYFKATAPRVKRTAPKKTIASVETMTAHHDTPRAVIQAMGTVTPACEITLQARVAGEVLSISPKFLPGGVITKGEILLKLDPADYEVAVIKAESALQKARAELTIEQGSQAVAREELRLLDKAKQGDFLETDLALRKPQLEQAQAAVTDAEADLHQAQLNLSRIIVTAPFNALVTQRNVNIGAHVNTQEALATLVGTDSFWIQAAVPLDRLALIDTQHRENNRVTVYSQSNDSQWTGEIIHTTGRLNEKSRMANMLIAVPDPLKQLPGATGQALMLDDYVSVNIEGKQLPPIIDIPRLALRDQDTVWVYHNGQLAIRPVRIVWKQGERVFIDQGLKEDDQVIVSDLPLPVAGMRLKSTTTDTSKRSTPSAPTEERPS